MGKRKLKTLNGKRVVLTSNPNLIGRNEIGILEINDDSVEVKEVNTKGELVDITGGSSTGGEKIHYYKFKQPVTQSSFNTTEAPAFFYSVSGSLHVNNYKLDNKYFNSICTASIEDDLDFVSPFIALQKGFFQSIEGFSIPDKEIPTVISIDDRHNINTTVKVLPKGGIKEKLTVALDSFFFIFGEANTEEMRAYTYNTIIDYIDEITEEEYYKV